MKTEVTNELQRRNYLKDLLMGLASVKFTRNIRGLGSWFSAHSNPSVSVVNSNQNDRIVTALKERANVTMDHSLKSTLLVIAEIFEKENTL